MKNTIIIPFRETKIKVSQTNKILDGKPLFKSNRNYYTIENGVTTFVGAIPKEERTIGKPKTPCTKN